MSWLPLVLDKLVILQFQVVQLIEKSHRDMKTKRMMDFLSPIKLPILLEAVKTAYDRDQPHNVLPPIHFLDVFIHRGVGESSIDETVPFPMA